MSRVNLFNGATITVEGTSESYHTFDDWGLYITNTDIIGEPKQYTRYIEIPGRNGLLDLSETIAGRQIYTSREIKMTLAGARDKVTWNAAISILRNKINGKICRISFDDDKTYYWTGRIVIKDFSSALNLGKLTIDVPTADPYKYSMFSSTEPWLWDPFNFETDYDYSILSPYVTVNGNTKTFNIYSGNYPFTIEAVWVSGTTTVSFGGITKSISSSLRSAELGKSSYGSNVLSVSGIGSVKIKWRGGSL